MKKLMMATSLVLAAASFAFAEGQAGKGTSGAADSSIPAATNPNTSNAPPRPGITGAPAADSSLPRATNPNTSNAPARPGTTGAPAADSSLPGASKK